MTNLSKKMKSLKYFINFVGKVDGGESYKNNTIHLPFNLFVMVDAP
jgi:hypothetical protein